MGLRQAQRRRGSYDGDRCTRCPKERCSLLHVLSCVAMDDAQRKQELSIAYARSAAKRCSLRLTPHRRKDKVYVA
jgi:hypothetical protein